MNIKSGMGLFSFFRYSSKHLQLSNESRVTDGRIRFMTAEKIS